MATRTKTARPPRPDFACSECGWTTTKWVGRCGECQEWGTVVEKGGAATSRVSAVAPGSPALPLTEITADAAQSRPTHVVEFDRVLGGGIVDGAVILLAGEPGIGKSTLLLAVAALTAKQGRKVLYVTGEESASQVRMRADRVDAVSDALFLTAETDLATVLGHIEAVRPELVIVDSVQTMSSSSADGTPGGVTQVRDVAIALINTAKTRHIPVVLVGHVTKDGNLAGPRTLEHLVDVVCQFEGDRGSRLRMVRSVKNRFGPTDEVGCFELGDAGITSVTDPSGLFLSQRAGAVAGTCVTVTIEGRRPLTVEVQALVAASALANPRRATSGVESSRMAMLLAVLHRHLGLPLMDSDVYVSTVGGVRVGEPAVDLALALAVASAKTGQPLAPGTIAIGEVSLAGDLRPVLALNQRLAEARRLGFTRAIVPASRDLVPVDGLEIVQASDLVTATQRSGVLVTD